MLDILIKRVIDNKSLFTVIVWSIRQTYIHVADVIESTEITERDVTSLYNYVISLSEDDTDSAKSVDLTGKGVNVK